MGDPLPVPLGMPARIVISVRFHDGRYHGVGGWPPAPARLFQAFIAGLGLGGKISREESDALRWLEGLEPPTIRAPRGHPGEPVQLFVPRNDLDEVAGQVSRVREIRMPKHVHPTLFEPESPVVYEWGFIATEETIRHARIVVGVSEHLYRLGHGVDMAWASASILEGGKGGSDHPGQVFRPVAGDGALSLDCPRPGSFQSLEARHHAFRNRLQRIGGQTVFAQPPRPSFRSVRYGSSPDTACFELRTSAGRFLAWPLTKGAQLVDEILASLRDAGLAPERLKNTIDVVPLPSIGHDHADLAIRRIVIVASRPVPQLWRETLAAMEGLHLRGGGAVAFRAPMDDAMLRHYGTEVNAELWHTITPVVIESPPRSPGPIGAADRLRMEGHAAAAVEAALMDLDVGSGPVEVIVQREPFHSRGRPATDFELRGPGWPVHARVRFSRPVRGLIVAGRGRDQGLGLFAPVRGGE